MTTASPRTRRDTRLAIDNRQRAFRVDHAALRALAAALLARAARSRGGQGWREVTLVLVDDDGSLAINRAALGHDGATDVITLSYVAIPGEPPGDSAEIVLNVARAWLLRRPRWSAGRELSLYLAHACDHLAGHNDATPASYRAMRRRELRWLRQPEVSRLAGLATLLRPRR